LGPFAAALAIFLVGISALTLVSQPIMPRCKIGSNGARELSALKRNVVDGRPPAFGFSILVSVFKNACQHQQTPIDLR